MREKWGLKECRMPECGKKTHRFGLCTKHRAWVERGHMTMDLRIVKTVPERNRYKGAVCLVGGCGKQPRRNDFCVNHAAKFQRGVIDAKGNVLKPRVLYPPDFECLYRGCGKRGNIRLGFCGTHYMQHHKGIIDAAGYPLRELRKQVYGLGDVCKVQGCGKRPERKGWCNGHRAAHLRGSYDAEGVRTEQALMRNKGLSCTSPGCSGEAHAKRLCVKHYWRSRNGYLGPGGWKNAGHPCSELGCGMDASVRTLCVKHYARLRRVEKRVKRQSEARPTG